MHTMVGHALSQAAASKPAAPAGPTVQSEVDNQEAIDSAVHTMVGHAVSQAAAHKPAGSAPGASAKASAQAAQGVYTLQDCSAKNSDDSQV